MRSCSDYTLRRVEGGCMFSGIRVVDAVARGVNVCFRGVLLQANSRSRVE